MSIKDELHELVEQLSDEHPTELFQLARAIHYGETVQRRTPVPLKDRGQPSIVSGRDAFNAKRKSLSELAEEQGVSPFAGRSALPEGVFTVDEVDEFVKAVREWRREG